MDPALIANRWHQLYSERKTLDDTLQLVERFVMPYRDEFYRDLLSEHQVNWRRRSIYDGTAVNDCEQLASAMTSNIAPFSMKWFNLSFRDTDINANQEAREWLDECEDIVWRTLLESDFHGEFAKSTLDIVGFGTNTILMEEKDDLIWQGLDFTATPLMDTYYELGPDDKISRSYHRKRWTSLQAIEKFPDSDLKELTKEDPVDKKKEYILAIYYRDDHEDIDVTKFVAPDKRPVGFKWICLESLTELKEGGYYNMPAMRNIWKATAGSKYGHSPSMISLSDIMQTNEFVAQLSEANAKALDPAFWTTERGFIGDVELMSGGITNTTGRYGEDFGIMPEGTNFNAATDELDRLQQAIHRHFKIDMLDLKESPAMTATEVMERRDRQREQFGPTVGGVERSVLEHVIENTFESLARNGQLPQQPESVVGTEMDIEYTGKLSRLMRSAEADATSIWVQEGMNMATIEPAVMDGFDLDEVVVGTGDARGIPAKYRRDEDTIKQIRELRAEQQQKQAELENLKLGGEAMKSAGAGLKSMQGMNGGEGVQQ